VALLLQNASLLRSSNQELKKEGSLTGCLFVVSSFNRSALLSHSHAQEARHAPATPSAILVVKKARRII
jgi:hypothetical protein